MAPAPPRRPPGWQRTTRNVRMTRSRRMEPNEILMALRRHALLIVAYTLAGVIIGAVIATFATPIYTSRASARVAAERGDGSRSVSSSATVISAVIPALIEVGSSQPVLTEVARTTGLSYSQVEGAVRLSHSTNSLVIEVTGQGSGPEQAQAIAQAEIEALGRVVNEMSVRVQDDEAAFTLFDVDQASLPTDPSGPSRKKIGVSDETTCRPCPRSRFRTRPYAHGRSNAGSQRSGDLDQEKEDARRRAVLAQPRGLSEPGLGNHALKPMSSAPDVVARSAEAKTSLPRERPYGDPPRRDDRRTRGSGRDHHCRGLCRPGGVSCHVERSQTQLRLLLGACPVLLGRADRPHTVSGGRRRRHDRRPAGDHLGLRVGESAHRSGHVRGRLSVPGAALMVFAVVPPAACGRTWAPCVRVCGCWSPCPSPP